jgi:hypothetical protein
VALILGGERQLGRQIDDLMASGRERVASEFARESGMAVGTGVRDQGDEEIDRIDRLEEAEGALVAGLATPFSVGARQSGRAFGSARWVGRGRPRGVLGVLVEPCLELGDLGVKRRQLGLEISDQDLEGLATRAIGMRYAHTAGVRAGGAVLLPT